MADLIINNIHIKPGQRVTIDLPVAQLYTHTPVNMPVQVIRGKRTGPSLFVCAAIHGDEINGVEIIRRLLALPKLNRLRGTLIAVPIVNVFGFLNHSRYLPDRRDLNRSFPGSEKGSLTARMADLFLREIVANATHGIDLHTAALNRSNLPQIRTDMDNPDAARLAHAFGAPVVLNSVLRDGSLRQVAAERGIPLLVYEAGEALRFDEVAIRAGVRGVIEVMRALGMLTGKSRSKSRSEEARSSSWVRASSSGILRNTVTLGKYVRKDEPLGVVSDPFGGTEHEILAPARGIVIGSTNLPLVNEGDALFHLARFESPKAAAALVEEFQDTHAASEDEARWISG